MNCKDCIYFKRCVALGVELNMDHNKDAVQNCRHFKNKADFVEVVHGKWEHKNDIDDVTSIYKCSVCDNDENFCDSLIRTGFYEYCPHCGAKMDE